MGLKLNRKEDWMFEENFGTFPKKKVAFNGEVLLVGKTEVDLKQVEAVFQLEPSFTENGHIHFSYDGQKPRLHDKTYFYYTKKQADKVEELLNLLAVEASPSHSLTGQAKQELKGISPKKQKNRKVCPNCGSANIDFIENNKKGFSVGKAAAGGLLTGGIGTLAGFAGKKGKKDTWHCKECGEVFELKTK